MRALKVLVYLAAIIVLLICIYTFLLGNEVFKGKFENDGLSWYFLAKGLYCSLSLFLLFFLLEVLKEKKSS